MSPDVLDKISLHVMKRIWLADARAEEVSRKAQRDIKKIEEFINWQRLETLKGRHLRGDLSPSDRIAQKI